MRSILVVVIAVIGVLATIFSAYRAWRLSRNDQASKEAILGYIALMILISASTALLLRPL